MKNVILPELGEGIEKATVAGWNVAEGDKVSPNDDIVELVTDKASFNVQAEVDGILKKILVQEGQDVRIGETLAVIDNAI